MRRNFKKIPEIKFGYYYNKEQKILFSVGYLGYNPANGKIRGKKIADDVTMNFFGGGMFLDQSHQKYIATDSDHVFLTTDLEKVEAIVKKKGLKPINLSRYRELVRTTRAKARQLAKELYADLMELV